MRAIARFYTWFWSIYFPVCIAFTEIVKFDYSDELLTILLLVYAMLNERFLVKDRWKRWEIFMYIILMSFYLLYSLLIHITTPEGVMLDLMQQIRPYAIFYLTWMMAPDFSNKQKKLLVRVMLVTYGVYFAAFYYKPELVSPFLAGDMGFLDRESGALGQLALCCGMIYYLFTPPTKRNKYIAIGIVLLGIFSGKSKYFGECVAFIALVVFLQKRIKFNNAKIYLEVGLLAVVILFFTWTKFNIYYVDGMMSNDREKARPETYKTGVQIMKDYFPFGSGLGSFGCAAAAKVYSPLYYKYDLDEIWGLSPDDPMFLADTFYPIQYAEYGVFGVFLFIWFWVRRIKEVNRISDPKYYKMAFMCILALGLESTADSSYLSGKGMGYFMILAMCLNYDLNIARRKKLLDFYNQRRAHAQKENNVDTVLI